jgi:hypothetical protein
MPQDLLLTGEQAQWLRRAAFSRSKIESVPAPIGQALIASGLAEENLGGAFNATAAGMRYLEQQGLAGTSRRYRLQSAPPTKKRSAKGPL